MSAVYDIVFTKSGTSYSYMLKQAGNTKDWLVGDAPLLPQTLITESASPTNIQPEREIQISQVDWRKGFQDYKLDDAYKYYESENCDARFKEEVILSPKKLSAISYASAPATPSLTDGGIEAWDDVTTPTNWTETGDTTSREAIVKHGGNYSAEWGGGNDGTIYQDISWLAAYQGMLFTAKAWGHSDDFANSSIKIRIDDGVGNSTSANVTADSTWEQLSITHRMAASATRLRIEAVADTAAGDMVRVDDITIDLYPATSSGATAKKINFGDNAVAVVGKNLYTIGASTTTLKANFEYDITDLCVFENYLYIAQGWSYAYWYTADLATFTESTLTGGVTANVTATTSAYDAVATAIDVVDSSVYSAAGVYARWDDEVIEVDAIVDADTITAIRAQLGSTAAAHATATDITELAAVTGAKYMSSVGGSQFWISDSNNTMRDSDDPINNGTPFSSAYTVGSDDYDIAGLVDHNDIVFCRKEDDVYYLSGSDVFSLLNLNSESSTSYTYGLHLWGNSLYIASGVNSLYEYNITSGVATTISPVRYAMGDANYDEEVLAITHDETYLYVAVDNGSDLKILAGRWETVDGDTDWFWHPLYDKTSNDITSMLISSATGSKRLYAGTDTSTDGILPFIVPVGYSAVYLESGWENEAAGDFITPWYVSNFPTETKYWKSVDITSICITDKTSMTPYYQKKGGSWTALTACTTSALDGGNYPAETTDSRDIDQSSERIRFKFSMAAADDDYTPILYGTGGGIVTYAVLETDKKRQIIATIELKPQIRKRDDSTEERVVSTDLSNLRTLYQGTGEMTVTGPDETAYTVVFGRDGYQEQLGYDESGKNEVWWCTARLLET